MIELNEWNRAVEIHIPAFEAFVENGLQKQFSIQLEDTANGSNEDAHAMVRQGETIVRFVEQTFHSEIFFGFSKGWDSLLTSRQKADGDSILNLSAHIMEMIAGAMAETGAEVDVTAMEIIPERELSGAFNLQHYFQAHLQLIPTADEGNEQNNNTLDFWVAASHPDEEIITDYVQKFEDSPFRREEYSEKAVQFASQINLNTDQSSNGSYKAGISMKGQQVEFEDFGQQKGINNTREVRNIDILKDVEMHVSVELGRRKMPLGKILQLVKGSVIELEKLAGEPVEILVNGHKIAQGDVVVIDEHFGVRISNLLASQERIKELQ